MSSKCCKSCGITITQDNGYIRKLKSGKTSFYTNCKKCTIEKACLSQKHRKDIVNARQRAAYAVNPEPVKARCRAYTRNNPEQSRKTRQNYYQNNTEMYAAKNAQRRSILDKVSVPLTPVEEAWLEFYYHESSRLTKETGVQHHVDHIKPISKGGLHAPWNLQVLTADENLRKGAKWHSEAA